MKKWQNRNGFTMMEIMMAVAIIATLAAVSFIGVAGLLRSMAQLERDSVAKEIFVSAQNHLTMAEGQGYLGMELYGTQEEDSSGIYYYIVNSGTVETETDGDFDDSVLGLMLPFGAVDETVRLGGNYVVRYQAESGNVLDVFYCPSGGERYLHTFTDDEYSELVETCGDSGDEYKKNRRYYTDDSVIGWYGGGDNVTTGDALEAPEIKVINEEKLLVEMTDNNDSDNDDNAQMQVILTGTLSGAQKAFDLKNLEESRIDTDVAANEYVITLDDLTVSGMHFSDLAADTETAFIPGEDVTVQAVAFSNTVYTNIASSAVKTVNSLFAELEIEEMEDTETASSDSTDMTTSDSTDTTTSGSSASDSTDTTTSGATASDSTDTTTAGSSASDSTDTTTAGSSASDSTDAENALSSISSSTAMITNIRHLENLSGNISSVAVSDLKLTGACQRSDLSWTEFKEGIWELNESEGGAPDPSIFYRSDSSEDSNEAGYFVPVCIVDETGETFEEADSIAFSYDGLSHRISGIAVKYENAGTKGIFGTYGPLTASTGTTSLIANLEIVDFCIEASGNEATGVYSTVDHAGALAGVLQNTDVENVIAYNSSSYEGTDNIVSASGSAGGLVGSVSGGSLTACAAALYVRSEAADAGGLAGAITGDDVTVTGCYSGGHTVSGSGAYSQNVDEDSTSSDSTSTDSTTSDSTTSDSTTSDSTMADSTTTDSTTSDSTSSDSTTTDSTTSGGLVNVIAAGSAGGLIGDAGAASISKSYSTCSVYTAGSDSCAGGLVGTASGTIADCYSTGWVTGEAEAESDTSDDTTSSSSGEDTTDTTSSDSGSDSSDEEASSDTKVVDGIGAFAGELTGSAEGCSYFMIINERYSEDDGFTYLSAVGGSESASGITAFDDTVSEYQVFANWSDSESAEAVPYDELIVQYYGYRYSLMSVKQLGAGSVLEEDSYVLKHYGDWPLPDVQTVNT